MEIDFDASGNGKVVRLNGSSVWTGTAAFFSNTNGRFRVGTRDAGTAGLFFNGWIASVSITGSYALSWLGTGTADADWLDKLETPVTARSADHQPGQSPTTAG
jgi:hypothetical protein